jgi:hypothetical protein
MPFLFFPFHLRLDRRQVLPVGPDASFALSGLAGEWLEIRVSVYLRDLNLLNQAIAKIALLLQHGDAFELNHPVDLLDDAFAGFTDDGDGL